MNLLQVTFDTSTTWRTILQDGNQIAQIIGVIMIVIYVVYTYKTFQQIKKQTDYQQDAYLKIESLIAKDLIQTGSTKYKLLEGKLINVKNSLPTKYLNTSISTKMTNILKPIFNFDDNLFEGNYYTIRFTNYGNAEVNKIILQMTITVNNSKELIEKKMLRDKEIQTLMIEIPEIIGRNGGSLKVPLLSTASFPLYSISLQCEYYDVRNKKYLIPKIEFSGENAHLQTLPA